MKDYQKTQIIIWAIATVVVGLAVVTTKRISPLWFLLVPLASDVVCMIRQYNE